jgi:hypothetical protein
MIRLLKTARFSYLSIIKKHPNGLGNRLERFDDWTKTWNDPNIKTYHDYFHNGEIPKFDVTNPDCEASKHEFAQCAARHRPAIFENSEKFNLFENEFGTDQFLSAEAGDLDFRKFLKECLKA